MLHGSQLRCLLRGSALFLWVSGSLAVMAIGLMAVAQWLGLYQVDIAWILLALVGMAWARVLALTSFGLATILIAMRTVFVCRHAP